jgi:hypothetical protein
MIKRIFSLWFSRRVNAGAGAAPPATTPSAEHFLGHISALPALVKGVITLPRAVFGKMSSSSVINGQIAGVKPVYGRVDSVGIVLDGGI